MKRCALLAIGQLCRTSGPALYDHIDELDKMIKEALGGNCVIYFYILISLEMVI